jgi:OmcA/MtrC family decaheme c-type cytochrome
MNRGGWWGLVATGVLAAALSSCGGSGSDPEPAPPAPPPVAEAPPVPVPTGTSPITLTANTPAATFAALAPKVTVGKIVIASPPVVHFSMTDTDGNAIIGYGSTSKSSTATVASYPNIAFALAKLVPGSNGSPSKWVSYIVTTVPTTTAAAAPTRPSTDNTGTLVDNKNGTYSYTFYRDVTKVKEQVAAMTVAATSNKDDLGDLTFEPGAVHRLTIQVSGNAPGTGTNTANAVQVTPGVPMVKPVDVIHDFIPATGKAVAASDPSREIVATSKCNDCHRKLGGIPGDSPESSGAGFHGGSRNETKYCVVCHTEQRKYGRTEATINAGTKTFTSTTTVVDGRAVGNLTNHIHKTHMGKHLVKKNYNYGGVLYNEVAFPQDIRNCTKCHDGSDTSTAKTAQGNNWMNVPSRLACGACHDGINFATGKGLTLADAAKGLTTSQHGHVGGAQADDSLCVLCHKPAAIDLVHLPVTPPNLASALHVVGGSANTNAAWIASNTSRLPAGAIKISYDIKSTSVNASGRAVMVFRMLQNGARKDLNDFATTAANPATGAKELWDNFMGAPSVYFVFAVPQDGINEPADFNATASSYLKNIWGGTASGSGAGTLTGPDADGYYTVTLTGVTIPASARMLTGGLGYSYNVSSSLPLTQTNLEGYPVAVSPIGHANEIGGLIVIAPNAQKVATGYVGRRAIVEDARCNKCHQELGTFTEESFHGGQRNDGSTCSWCHTPNRASSGWSADSTGFIHAIHAGAKRTKPFTWHALSLTESFAGVKYPSVLKECETCHLPGTYDFTASASASALPNRQYRTAATGIFNGTATAPPLNVFSLSPYVIADNVTSYGSGFSFNAATGVTTAAAATTLVNSPITTACFACHDGDLAVAHMRTNGGSIYATRGVALATAEQCTLCHAAGRVADIKAMHEKP